MLDRRSFTFHLASAAFAGLALRNGVTFAREDRISSAGYGPLVSDPHGLLDLPKGFSYRILSRFGDRMDDGYHVPDRCDGMGTIPLDNGRIALIRNHELRPQHASKGPFRTPAPAGLACFDHMDGQPLPGGTTTLVYNVASGKVESQYLSLAGTIRNCAGGTTPWRSWLTCEEDVSSAANGLKRDHGWVFEVPASRRGLADPVPLVGMGRFNHEAVAVDPRTGIVYLTEDRDDSLLYRFLPNQRGQLARGGQLQALAYRDPALRGDSRNWNNIDLPVSQWREVRWITLDNVESPQDDLRKRGHAAGAVVFARGEGIHFGNGELYFCCTSGGAARLSQIMRYRPSAQEGQADEIHAPGMIQLFLESTDPAQLNYGDNLVVAPHGDIIVCEDQYTEVVANHLRGVTPDGLLYEFARLRSQTELAGACFAPDGGTMFVNLYSPGMTLAITGPWASRI